MYNYETFRLSVIGWSAWLTWIWLSFPLLNISGDGAAWLGFAGAILSGPIIGYLISQLERSRYGMQDRRANDHNESIKDLHTFVRTMAAKEDGFHVLAALKPKDLHRFVWVAYANSDLRARSESYWERYYTNRCVVLAFVLACFAVAVHIAVSGSVLDGLEWVALALRTLVVVGIAGALLRVNRKYVQIGLDIEATWNYALIEVAKEAPHAFLSRLFK